MKRKPKDLDDPALRAEYEADIAFINRFFAQRVATPPEAKLSDSEALQEIDVRQIWPKESE